MDLTKELKEIEDNSLPVEKLIENLEQEQVNLGKKIHMLKVINLSRAMTHLIQSEIPKDKISGMILAYYQQGDNYQFSIHLVDKQENRLKIDAHLRDKFKSVVELLKNNGKINQDYVSESFCKDRQGKILFDREVDKQIFDLLLNEELKTSLNYSQLAVKVKDKEDGQKRPKI